MEQIRIPQTQTLLQYKPPSTILAPKKTKQKSPNTLPPKLNPIQKAYNILPRQRSRRKPNPPSSRPHRRKSPSKNKKCHSIIVEYPSYGVYSKKEPSEKRIFEDALSVFDFCVEILNFDPEEIIVFGRSIGTAPACFLGSQRKFFLLVLFSPFWSLRNLVFDKVNFLNVFVKNRFRNFKYLKDFRGRLFILHGKRVF